MSSTLTAGLNWRAALKHLIRVGAAIRNSQSFPLPTTVPNHFKLEFRLFDLMVVGENGGVMSVMMMDGGVKVSVCASKFNREDLCQEQRKARHGEQQARQKGMTHFALEVRLFDVPRHPLSAEGDD